MALTEAQLIATLVAACDGPAPPVGPGDDGAVVTAPARGRQVVTTDALVEGVHFLRGHPPKALAWKALAVNLSDVAAMGARPAGFVLSAAVPRALPEAWWSAFARGLGGCARAMGVALVGGDTVASPGPLVLSITAWGWTAGPKVLTRSGGRAGDVLMVCGDVGRSALGFARWREMAPEGYCVTEPTDLDPCVAAHLRPTPPLDAGPWALERGASAGMDLSDGLVTDLPRLAVASGVEIQVELSRLPHDAAVAELSADARAAGGEDYGLAVLVPAEHVSRFATRGFQAIGEASKPVGGRGPGVVWRLHGEPATIQARPFAHFD